MVYLKLFIITYTYQKSSFDHASAGAVHHGYKSTSNSGSVYFVVCNKYMGNM